MSKSINLEELRELLKEDILHMRCGLVKDLLVSPDRSVLRVTCCLLPEMVNINARMSWDMVGPDAGAFQFPSKDDLVLIAFCEDNEDEAFVVRRLTSKVDKIPVKAVDGHLVFKALPGTKAFLNSDTEINLTREEVGDERLVLGDTFKTAYSEHLDIDATHDHIGNLGYNTTPPNQAADYIAIKNSPVDDEAMLSDLTKTEK